MKAYHKAENVNVIGKIFRTTFHPQIFKREKKKKRKQYLIEVVIVEMLSILK